MYRKRLFPMMYIMISAPRRTRQLMFGVLSAIALLTHTLHAEELSIRHEISPVFSLSSYDHSYDDYVINGESSPLISGRYESEYQQYSLHYAFFFTPISDDPQIPIALQKFYAHPTQLRMHATVRPEFDATRIFQNGTAAYRATTSYTPQSRSAGVELEFYPWEKTGITVQIDSGKDEEYSLSSNTLGTQGSGSSDEIQRSYGLGLLHYFAGNIRLSVAGAILDREYVSIEKNWDEESPLLTNEHGVETDADGLELELAGTYIFRENFSLRGGYRYYNSESHSETTSSYYDNFPAGESFYDDDTTEHDLQASLEWYWRPTSSCRVGGGFRRYELERRYETDQNVLYAWNIWSFRSDVSHYISRHVGLWLSYDVSLHDGSVETWHPEAEGDPRTTFQTRSDVHTFQAGVKVEM